MLVRLFGEGRVGGQGWLFSGPWCCWPFALPRSQLRQGQTPTEPGLAQPLWEFGSLPWLGPGQSEWPWYRAPSTTSPAFPPHFLVQPYWHGSQLLQRACAHACAQHPLSQGF